jgi:hypothetical protein
MWAVEMVIPRFRSSGALSIAPYSRKLARPFSAWRLVIAADRVVYSSRPLVNLPVASQSVEGKEKEVSGELGT